VNDLIRTEISSMIHRELNDPRLNGGVVSITRVQTSPDMRHARVYVSVMGEDEGAGTQVLAALKAASGYMHRELRSRLAMKNIPDLAFFGDSSIAEGAHLLKIMRDLPPPTTGDQTD
jgi:ribosome-binding factor A